METTIRKAEETDARSLAEFIMNLGWFPDLDSGPGETLEERIRRYVQASASGQSHTVYVAEDDQGACLGYTAVHWAPYLIFKGPEGYVSELFIAEHARGMGMGTRLLEEVKAEARARGCMRLGLLNDRRRESYHRGFYKSRGWEEREHIANMIFPLHK